MAQFKEMDPQLVWKAIEGYKDALSEPSKKREQEYQEYSCPRCKCGLQKSWDPRIGWKPGKSLPQFLLECDNCGFMIDPSTNIIVQYGNAAKTPTPDMIPIIDPD